MKIETNCNYEFDEQTSLWRYVDLHGLLYFLIEESIYFTQLKKFDDPFEGFSNANLWDYFIVQSTPSIDNLNWELSKEDQEAILEHKEISNTALEVTGKVQKLLFASCWVWGQRESHAMWNLYSNKDSVVLRFSANYLIKKILKRFELLSQNPFEGLFHGKVDYLKISPFDPTDTKWENVKHKYKGFIKDESFSHENEFRFIVIAPDELKVTPESFSLPIGPLNQLEFEIVCHPKMEDWKVNNISQFFAKLEIPVQVKRSQLSVRRKH